MSGPLGVVCTRVAWATSPWSRLRGILGRLLEVDDALVLRPCRRVHTWGVGHPLDVVFCDADLNVLHVETVRPRRLSQRVPSADLCIELRAGRSAECGIRAGVRLVLEGPA